MATYLYPEARELKAIGPNLMAQETLNDPLLGRVFPIRSVNAASLQWSLEDDDLGLQQLRGLDGSPVHVHPVGKTSYVSEPGYFGEFMTITERELTLRAGSVTGDVPVDVGDLVATKFRQLRHREITRIRQIGWTLLTTGTFSISGKESTLIHTDTFALQTHSASDWNTVSTSTPLADFRATQALGAEFGVNFGSASIAIMNRRNANLMLSSTTANDISSRRGAGGGTVTSVGGINSVLLGEDLPEIIVYDDGYKNDSGTFVKFVPDDKVIIIGQRMAGDVIGEYRMTRNLNNPGGAPGHYEYIKDYSRGVNAEKLTAPKIEVHSGHNGGPIVYRPKAIVVMST